MWNNRQPLGWFFNNNLPSWIGSLYRENKRVDIKYNKIIPVVCLPVCLVLWLCPCLKKLTISNSTGRKQKREEGEQQRAKQGDKMAEVWQKGCWEQRHYAKGEEEQKEEGLAPLWKALKLLIRSGCWPGVDGKSVEGFPKGCCVI